MNEKAPPARQETQQGASGPSRGRFPLPPVNATFTCPACNGTGVTGNRWPQALRLLDGGGRFTLPWGVRERSYRCELRGAVVWFVPDPAGLAVPCPVRDGSDCWRLTIPKEFRQAIGLRPGDDVALAKERDGSLLVWRHE